MNYLEQIPPEMLNMITGHLSGCDRANLSMTSKLMRHNVPSKHLCLKKYANIEDVFKLRLKSYNRSHVEIQLLPTVVMSRRVCTYGDDIDVLTEFRHFKTDPKVCNEYSHSNTPDEGGEYWTYGHQYEYENIF